MDRRQVRRRLGVFDLRAAGRARARAPLLSGRLLFHERQHLAQLFERDLLHGTVDRRAGERGKRGRQRARVERLPLVDHGHAAVVGTRYHAVPADGERRRRNLDVVRGGHGTLKHRLGLLEAAAAKPLAPFAEHEEPRAVTPDPVLLQTVPALGLHAVLHRSRLLHVFQQQATAAGTLVRLDRLHGHVVAVLLLLLFGVQVRVDAARRPFPPTALHRGRHGAVTTGRRVQFGQHGRLFGPVRRVVGRRRGRSRRRHAVSGVELRVPPIVADVLVRGDAQRGDVHVEHAQVQQQH